MTRDELIADARYAHSIGDTELEDAIYKKLESLSEQKPAVKYNPTDDMSGGERFMAGIGKGLSDTWLGAKQAVTFVPSGKRRIQAEIDERKKLDKALIDTPGGFWGNVAGQSLAASPAMFVPGANTVMGGAALGAIQGGLQPTASDESTLLNATSGAAGGAAGSAIGNALPFVGKALGALTQKGRGAIADELLYGSTDDVAGLIAKLKSAKQYVNGATPTVAEVALEPKVSTLQKAVGRLPDAKNILKGRQIENNGKIVEAISGIAKNDAALEAAKAARRNATKQAYDDVHNVFIQSDPELERILGTSAAQDAFPSARKIASNEYRQFGEAVPSMQGMEGKTATLGKDAGDFVHWTRQPINYDRDNLATAIRKLGGISKEMAQSTYGNRMWEDGLGAGLFRNNGGQSLDDMAARLVEHGYLPEGSGPYELVEKLYKGQAVDTFSHAKSGFDDVYSASQTESDSINESINKLIKTLENKNKSKTEALPLSPYDKAYYGKDLHNIQRVMRENSTNPATDGVTRASIKNVYDDYLAILENKIPGLLDVNKQYAELSKPIDKMLVAGRLRDKLIPALMDNDSLPTRMRPNAYAEALRNENATIKAATKQKNKGLGDVYSPEELKVLTGIKKHLQRSAKAEDLAKEAGSDTAANLIADQLLRRTVGPIGLPSTFIDGLLSKTSAGMIAKNAIPGAIERDIQMQLANRLVDPVAALDSLLRVRSQTESRHLTPRITGLLGSSLAVK